MTSPDADPGSSVQLRLAELCPGDLPHGALLGVASQHVRHHPTVNNKPRRNPGSYSDGL